MLKKKICNHKVILLAIMIFTLSFAVMPIMFANALVEPGVLENPVPPGCQMIDFEEGVDRQDVLSTIEGLEFTATGGFEWVYADIRTGAYNGRSLTDTSHTYGPYVLNGYFCTWLEEIQGTGRIDFTLGTASYFSILVSTASGLMIDAYASDDTFLATSGWAPSNYGSYTFTRLTIEAEGMAYVIIHDTGNLWIIDDLVTDAPGVGIIPATIDFDPDTLNPKSSGKYVTVYIELPEGYDVNDIDINTIELTYGVGGVFAEVTPTEIGDHDENGVPDLMVKFDRQDVIAILEPGEEIEITISGESWEYSNNGFEFEGRIDIRVLDFY